MHARWAVRENERGRKGTEGEINVRERVRETEEEWRKRLLSNFISLPHYLAPHSCLHSFTIYFTVSIVPLFSLSLFLCLPCAPFPCYPCPSCQFYCLFALPSHVLPSQPLSPFNRNALYPRLKMKHFI